MVRQDVDGVRGDLERDIDAGDCRASSAQLEGQPTGRGPVAGRSRGSYPCAWRESSALSSSLGGSETSNSRGPVQWGLGQGARALVVQRFLAAVTRKGSGRWRAVPSAVTCLSPSCSEGCRGLERGAVRLVGEHGIGEHRVGLKGELRCTDVEDEGAGGTAGQQPA